MRAQLLKVDGVRAAEVDFASKTARVTVLEGTDPAKVVAGVGGGYEARLKP